MIARLRWIMWGSPAFIFVFAFVHRVAPGVVAKEIMQAFGASGTIVGLLSAMYFYAYAGFMIPAGLLIDGLGVRRVVSAGGAVMGLGSLAMGLAATPSVLFGGRFLVGLGATVTFIGCLKIAASWFPPSHFGTMSAISATMGMLGALLGTAPLAALVAAAGWRGAFVTIGAVPLLGALLCFVFVRDHPRGHVEEGAPVPGLAEVVRGMLEVLGNRHTWPPFLAFFFLYSAMGNLMLWGVPFLRLWAQQHARRRLCLHRRRRAPRLGAPHRLSVRSGLPAPQAALHRALLLSLSGLVAPRAHAGRAAAL